MSGRNDIYFSRDGILVLEQPVHADNYLKIHLPSHFEATTITDVIDKLNALRRAHAIAFLVSNLDLSNWQVSSTVSMDEYTAQMIALIAPESQLFLQNVSEGSLWATIVTKTISSYESLLLVVGTFTERGRTAAYRMVESRADLKELEVDRAAFELELARANGTIDVLNKIDKIKNPETREMMRSAFVSSLLALKRP